MRDRPAANPPNRFHDLAVEYDDGEAPPPASVTILDDHSRSILSHNDSPDLGFSWSVNPYRGCQHSCSYCLAGDTAIAMVGGSTKPLASLAIGDEILGTRDLRLVPTRVVAKWSTRKPAVRVELDDGAVVVASAEHRFLTDDGWKHVAADHASVTAADAWIGLRRGELAPRARLRSIEPAGTMDLFDIATGTGDFIANGVVSHNCYARPTHEYLDLGAGTDFDTKIVVKRQAPALLRAAFDKASWKGEMVMFSGVTDCYQPIERDLQLTRGCLEVCLEYRNPVALISKSALVTRDLDLLADLTREAGCHVSVSLAWVDDGHGAFLARTIEPWAASPAKRFKVIESLAKAGVPVGVMIAPVIPGLNDDQLVRVMERARDAGATSAGWTLLRLPGAVAPVFEGRLRVSLPLVADKVMHRVRETRGGDKVYDARFGVRGRGEGVYAKTIAALFEATANRLGFVDRDDDRNMSSRFRRPQRGQLSLF